jgi:hypothetical protein
VLPCNALARVTVHEHVRPEVIANTFDIIVMQEVQESARPEPPDTRRFFEEWKKVNALKQ